MGRKRNTAVSAIRRGMFTERQWRTWGIILLFGLLCCCHVATAEYRGEYYFNGAKSYEDQQQEEEQRLHEIIVEDWYDLIRYLSGLGLCIFGLIGLYFHQFASYYFLKRYTSPTGTERKMGRVISCESMRIRTGPPSPNLSSSHDDIAVGGDGETFHKNDHEDQDARRGYRIFVVYSAPAPIRRDLCSSCGPDTTTISQTSISNESLVDTDYFQWFRTQNPVAIGSEVALILLKDNPKSACTPELLNSHLMQAFSQKNCHAVSLLGISLFLGVIVLMLASVFEILSMPHPETQRPIGWSILITFFFVFVIAGYLFCKMLFDHFKAKVFLSAFPAPSVRKRLRIATAASIISQDETTQTAIIHHTQHIDLEEGQQPPSLSIPPTVPSSHPALIDPVR